MTFQQLREQISPWYWDLSAQQDKLDETHTYTDKESYLEWVQQWKDTYKALTEEIRSYKKELREHQRKSAINRVNGESHLTTEETRRWINSHRERFRCRHFATALLQIRADGKVRSWRMKQEQQEVAA